MNNHEYVQNKNTLQNCYFRTAVEFAASFDPQNIVDMVISRQYDYKRTKWIHNQNKMYLVQFYIRGKPWIVGVDDIMPFKKKFIYLTDPDGQVIKQEEQLVLYFGQADYETLPTVMWGPIIEKAWVKVMGSYTTTQKGFVQNSMRAFMNCPVMTYFTKDYEH